MIKLIVLDVDGCLSDGGLIYSSSGVESKIFNVKDGLGISTWIKMGFEVAIITGRSSTIVEKRAKELGIKHLYQGVERKAEVLQEVTTSLGIKLSEVAAIGDDLNDFAMLKMVGRSFTPNNGVKEIRDIAQTTLLQKGGDGAVREMIDILVEENLLKDKFLSFWI